MEGSVPRLEVVLTTSPDWTKGSMRIIIDVLAEPSAGSLTGQNKLNVAFRFKYATKRSKLMSATPAIVLPMTAQNWGFDSPTTSDASWEAAATESWLDEVETADADPMRWRMVSWTVRDPECEVEIDVDVEVLVD